MAKIFITIMLIIKDCYLKNMTAMWEFFISSVSFKATCKKKLFSWNNHLNSQQVVWID